jgi:tetratricopeptide (TPR) repeat protein
MKRLILTLALAAGVAGYGQDVNKAEDLYHRTDYQGSLRELKAIHNPDARTYFLIGQDYYMLGQFKPAVDNFEKAAAKDPKNSDYALWLGRAWGRRAETASVFTAPMAASKARQYFELAVKLDPRNKEATGDLFDYYLNAPSFLGGGLDKATALAQQIAKQDPAEGHFAEAQLADRRKDYDSAEQQLRRAVELAPRQVGRILDLARYLAKQGRVQESEAAFAQAEKIDPNNPKLIYTKAKTYVEQKRNLEQAKALLKKYMQCNLTPEDPPKEEARRLLAKVSGV